MHLTEIEITNIRSIPHFVMKFGEQEAAGWHVVLGDNGAGKSSVIRSLALIFSGGESIGAMRQVWTDWLRVNEVEGGVTATLKRDRICDGFLGSGRQSNVLKLFANLRREGSGSTSQVKINFRSSGVAEQRSVWSLAQGWFSASFGPFRRFSGGDSAWEKLFVAPDYRRAASHFSAFGEDVALTEPLPWLRQLHVRALEDQSGTDSRTRDAVRDFFNKSGLLPHGAVISEITSQRILLKDGEGNEISVEQMSDGYRSVLSLAFELIRQMFVIYGAEFALKHFDVENAIVNLPGVVAIDEVDAHLHPAWQARIGDWFTTRFPKVQFIVTTHSPLICRAAAKGSIWRLPAPGSETTPGRVTGQDYDRLVSGNILEAMGTEFFGAGITRSKTASVDLDRIAQLNKRHALGQITKGETQELQKLQAAMPMSAASIAA
jgi:predicted ATPase